MMNAKEIANNAIAQAKADWVKSMTEDFYADEKKNPLNIGAVGVGNTIIVAYADSVDEPLIGVAKCNPTDSYDREVGIAIAYARAIGEDIPDYVLTDCSIGDYDEDEDSGYDEDWDDDDDDWDDDEDYDEDDEDYDEDEDDEDYLTFEELGIGAKYIYDDELYIKVSDNKAYRYSDKATVDFYCYDEIDEVIED